MITNLEIKNIALISYLSIDFNIGLTVMSGETGSGKSIIVDSLAFVLGERADKTMIKYGEEQAQVQVVFSVDVDSNAYRVMSELGFESDTTIIFSRTLTMSGKNECRINGKICSTSMLKQVASCLVDIFGQSQHLNLLKVDNHIGVLDGFVPCLELKGRLAYLYSEYRKIKKSLAEFGGSEAERDRMLDILKYQIDEIKEADLSVNEENELQATHIKVVNTEKIVTSLQNSLAFLSESESNALSCVSESASSLSNICDLDSKIKDCHKRLYASKIELEDISETLNDLLSSMDYDMREVDRMEERLEKIKNTKRKYGGSVDNALEFLNNAERQYNNLFDATAQIEKLNKEKSDIVKQMYAESEKLSNIRRNGATKLASEIENQLNDLGMKGTSFEVSFNSKPTIDEYESSISSNGYDKVEFLLSANVGEPLKPLAKVISGGEMSRFMLAIKNITATIENIPTMVFDEIDTGVSGNMAKKVATKLANVSRDYQCIVITHLPQIVAMADCNLCISKFEVAGRTLSSVARLNLEGKTAEVSRLMGGVGVHALPNALEMIDWANSIKKEI